LDGKVIVPPNKMRFWLHLAFDGMTMRFFALIDWGLLLGHRLLRNSPKRTYQIYILVQWKIVVSRDVNFVEDGVSLILTRSRVVERQLSSWSLLLGR